MGRAFPQRGGRAVDEHSEIYVGLDVAKARHAVAVADGERQGEVRYLARSMPIRPRSDGWSPGSRSGIGRCISVTRQGRPGMGFTGKSWEWDIGVR